MGCPKCQKVLRVRTEYLGRRVVCRHCQEGFRVTIDGVSARMDALKAELQQSQQQAPPAQEQLASAQARVQALEAQLREAGLGRQQMEAAQAGAAQELAALRQEHDRLTDELKPLRGLAEGGEALKKE